MKRNYRLTVSYDGTRYNGWEHQLNTDMTIQGKLEAVLGRMVRQTSDLPVRVIGAGRTDAGVHARAMTANVWLDTDMSEAQILKYMNQYLPEDISVNEVKIASDRFHSRFNARAKTYCYTCFCGPIKPVFDRRYVTVLDQIPDVAAMRRAAEYLTGAHDYRSFCGNPHMKKSTVREVDTIEIRQNGPYIRMIFHGSGFLQNMVRIMAGTLLEVGFGRKNPEDMQKILAEKNRKYAGQTAPAKGLCLENVEYQ